MARRDTIGRSSRSLMLAIALGLLLAAAGSAATQAFRVRSDRQRADNVVAEYDYLVAWATLIDSVETEFLTFSLAELDLAPPSAVQAASAARAEIEAESLATFDRIALQEHNVSDVAEFFAEELRAVRDNFGESAKDFNIVMSVELWDFDRWGLSAEPEALLDVYIAYQLPLLVGNDRVLGLAAQQWDELSPESKEWFAPAQAAVATEFEGWIFDTDAPFAYFVDVNERLEPTLPAIFDGLVVITEGESFQLLLQSDVWLGEWAEHEGTNPPAEFDEVFMAANDVRAMMFALATDAANQAALDASTRANDLSRRFWMWTTTFAVAGIAFLVLGATAYLRLDREARRWRRDASTDSLTGLSNGRALEMWADRTLSASASGDNALVLVDLDRFKTVNDTHGHLIGDALLSIVANRLADHLAAWNRDHERRQGDSLLARLGGDDFVIVLHNVDDLAKAVDLADQLRLAVGAPISTGDRTISISLSAGVAVGTGPSTLLDLRTEADIALAQAKQLGGDALRVFDDQLVRSIVQTINRGDGGAHIQAHMQAIYHLDGSYDYEALARWIPDDGDPVAAGRWWLPAQQAEHSRMLLETMVDRASAVFGADANFDGRLWLNVGPNNINAEGDADFLLELLADAEIDPERCGIEILETAPIIDISTSAQNLEKLRRSGMQVALDDFGSGFTPLGHLVRLPIDIVKLDRSVVAGIDHNPRHAALIAAVVQACDSLGLAVVAEGVEHPGELRALEKLGVRRVQGYLVHRPSAIEDLPPVFTIEPTDQPLVQLPSRSTEAGSRTSSGSSPK